MCVCADLKVRFREVDLQAEGVHPLGQGPRQQLFQREGVLTQPGQHVLHQDDLVAHLRLLGGTTQDGKHILMVYV